MRKRELWDDDLGAGDEDLDDEPEERGPSYGPHWFRFEEHAAAAARLRPPAVENPCVECGESQPGSDNLGREVCETCVFKGNLVLLEQQLPHRHKLQSQLPRRAPHFHPRGRKA